MKNLIDLETKIKTDKVTLENPIIVVYYIYC